MSAHHTQEEAVGGVTEGLIKLHDTVTWRAKHFGVWQRMTVEITEYNRPHFFVDEMIQGTFDFMRHEHEFIPLGEGTTMIDTFEFASPYGLLGRIVDKLILENYMRAFLIRRNDAIKEFAESNKWKQVL